ncbi:MAG: hypothetical protein CL912_32090 [Deltaproteobacteria bacterium]|nr:hypothetical protein [Deltaproteobacteria bacterium]|tara:strand:+ start:157 stop:393 length:237 start_codon:yes stop_codon:yes gene_type:complete
MIPDERYLEGTNGNPYDVRYINYSGNLDKNGIPVANNLNPNDPSSRPEFGDNYNFSENYDSGYPYHGGVSYGGNLGTV